MNWWQRLRRQHRLERELDAELRDHLARQAADYVAAGVPDAEARRRAVLEFGGLDQVKEICRDARGLAFVRDAAHDARYAFRMLRTHAGFTAVAVLALGLGIGANTALFSLVNGLLFRAPAVERPERLVFVSNCTGNEQAIEILRGQRHVLDSVGGWMATQFSLGTGGETEWVDGLWVTPGYFETLGVFAAVGRTIPDAGSERAVVISDAFWRSRFGGRPDAVGRSIAINHVPFAIAGITPPGFTGLDVGRTFDVIAPLITPPGQDGCGSLSVVARLNAGQTIDRATEALRQRLERRITLEPASWGRSDLRSRYERPLLTIMAVAALVLLMVCATIANLLLVRADARRQEMHVRLALGASRARLVRQVLVESLVLAALGAGAGLIVARSGSGMIVRELSAESILATGRTIFGSARFFLDVSLDWHVLAFAAALTLVTALLFGLTPAIRASHSAPIAGARATPSIGSGHTAGTAHGLVVAQVALSFVLIVAAVLFVRSLSSLVEVPLGFEPRRMIVVDISTAPSSRVWRRMPLYERAREAVRALPGVAEATLSVSAPMTGWDLLVEVEAGQSPSDSVDSNDSLANIVSPGWFRALGTPIAAGRDFTDRDGKDAPPVVVVNEAFGRQFLRGGSALGRTITIRGMGPETTPRTVVGVAADALWSLRDPVPPILYVPLAQADDESLELRVEEQGLTLGVRAEGGSPELLTKGIAAALSNVDPQLTLTFRSPARHITASLTQERVIAIISAFFGVLALALASVGLYGVTGYGVSCRRTEIGVRLALGGTPLAVARLVLAPLWRLVAAGVAAGLIASVVLAPLVSALLYGVGPRDVLTFSAAVVLLSAVAALSGWIPAFRAVRVNPIAALRSE